MKKIIIGIGIMVLTFGALGALGLPAQACYRCWEGSYHHCWSRYDYAWWDAEYDWVIKPEVLGDKLRIIANPTFIRPPRYDEYIVITGDPDHWQGDKWGMKWSDQGYLVDVPLRELPQNKRIRMNYVIMHQRSPMYWAIFSEDNDDEWTGPGDHGKTTIDFMLQYGRVIPVD